MNAEKMYQVILAPVVSEKTNEIYETSNQWVFKVRKDATKPEIKEAVETLFKVEVVNVSILNVKGKTKRTRHGMGVRSDWKKAYIRLGEGQEIDLEKAGA